MGTKDHTLRRFLVWVFIVLFVLFYPMLISIYVFLPLFIGVAGYMLIVGVDRGKVSYIVLSLLYMINMDVNLSLPFFLLSTSILFVYILIYPRFNHFRRCKVCRPILTVMTVDFIYLGFLLLYDFVFQTENIVLDDILLYPLIVDLIVAVML